jgi:hypothetical protein
MSAVPTSPAMTAETRTPMIGLLRILLLLEAAGGLAVTILLSLVASDLEATGGDADLDRAISIRFAAAAAFFFALFAAIASRGARRRRGWAWTMAAILQVLLAVGTGIAIVATEWQPYFLGGFGLAVLAMLVLSSTAVRRALGQQ